jgi:tetratricopeptide (TPR) repeat protein
MHGDVKMALRLHHQGQYNEAEALYRQRLSVNPLDVSAMHLLGVMACQSGYYSQASDIFSKVLQLGHKTAAVFCHLAYAQWQLENWSGAEQALHQSRILDPGLAQSRKLVTLIDREKKRRADRIERALNVTAVISCYESADTIGQTIMSLVNQTERPYEIVVTDDGSSEETCRYIRGLLDVVAHHGILTQFVTHARIAPYRLNTIRNNAIRHARGELIFITDGDTIIPKNIIAQHRHIHAASEKPLFLACLRKDLHGNGELRDLSKWWESFVENSANKEWNEIDLQAIFATATASYRKDVCESVGCYNEAFNGHWGFDDTEFGFRMKTLAAARVTVSGTICHIPHETSLGAREGTVNRKRYIESQLSVFKELFSY